jgi:hypothetical protein
VQKVVGAPEIVGVGGRGFTTTLTVPAALVHPPTVTVKEYVPEAAVVSAAPVIVGLRAAEANPFGPDQVLGGLAGPIFDNRLSVAPTQTGLLLVGAGVAGVALTVH